MTLWVRILCWANWMKQNFSMNISFFSISWFWHYTITKIWDLWLVDDIFDIGCIRTSFFSIQSIIYFLKIVKNRSFVRLTEYISPKLNFQNRELSSLIGLGFQWRGSHISVKIGMSNLHTAIEMHTKFQSAIFITTEISYEGCISP